MSENIKRVRVEYEMEDGTVRHVEVTDLVDFKMDLAREPRETTWERGGFLSHRTFEPGPLVELTLRVTARAAERSTP